MTAGKPSGEDLQALQEIGMTELEPGRWTGPWQGSDEDMHRLARIGPSASELNAALKAGQSANEEMMAEYGAHVSVAMQTLPPGYAAEPIQLLVYAQIVDSFSGSLDSLDPELIAESAERAMNQHPDLSPPDTLAVGLRRLGIKCRAEHLHPDHGVPPEHRPGFRAALFDLYGGEHSWV